MSIEVCHGVSDDLFASVLYNYVQYVFMGTYHSFGPSTVPT